MTESPLTVTPVRFDLYSDDHVTALARLFEDYLLEDFERLGYFPPGIPLSDWLFTTLLYIDGEAIGFSSSDWTRYAVELLYVAPAYRGHGVAEQHLAHLRDTCPGDMRIKAPLSPGGEALARKLNLPLSEPDQDEIDDSRRSIESLHRTIAARCPHVRKGNPSRPCPRCYRAVLKRAVKALVVDPCTITRTFSAFLGAA